MDGSFTADTVHEWLQGVADVGYVSLHYDSPSLNGVGAAEISGGGYTRVKASFSQPANRAVWTLADVRFTGLVQNQITHFGIWDAKTRGNLIAYAALPQRAVILNGGGYIIHAGDLALSIG